MCNFLWQAGMPCCHKKITHRLLTDAGSVVWSKRDVNANVAGDVNKAIGVSVSRSPGLLWTASSRSVGTGSPFLQWDTSGNVTDSTTLPDSSGIQGGSQQYADSDSSGNIYIVHFATGSAETVVKLDSSLNEVWRFVSPGHTGSRTARRSYGLVVSPDETRIACITELNKTGCLSQGRVAELNTSGSEIWSYTSYPTDLTSGESYVPEFCHYDPSGKLWVGFHAQISASGIGTGIWARFDSSGNIDRLVNFSSSSSAETFLKFSSAGDAYVMLPTGGSTSTVKQYSDTGSLLNTWSSEVATSGFANYLGFDIDANDNLYTFGNYGSTQPRLVSYQLDGTKNWHYDETASSLVTAGYWTFFSNDGYIGIGGPLRRK